MVVVLADWPRFRFIGMSVVGLAIGLSKAEGLAISGAILTEADITVSFSGLSLW